MRKHNTQGTTLVEVTVGSILLVSTIGLITLALAVVFESYASSQQRGAVDQDGQYILARLKYVGSQHDPQVIYSQQKSSDFSKTGSQLINIEQGNTEDDGIYLADNGLPGEYTSPPVHIVNPFLAAYFVAVVKRPPGTSIQYRIAVADAVSGGCETAEYEFVGEGKSSATYFTTDYFLIPTDDNGVGFENPGSCVRYKAFLTGASGETPIIYNTQIRR